MSDKIKKNNLIFSNRQNIQRGGKTLRNLKSFRFHLPLKRVLIPEGGGSIRNISVLDPFNRRTINFVHFKFSGALNKCLIFDICKKRPRFKKALRPGETLLIQRRIGTNLYNISRTNLSGVQEIEKLAIQLLKNKIWPMTDKIFYNKIRELIQLKQIEMAQRSVNIYTKLHNNHLAVINVKDFKALLEEAGILFSSIIWKIMAVELISLNSGATTAGVDSISFKYLYRDVETNSAAERIIVKRKEQLFNLIRLSTRGNSQVIIRIGKGKLNDNEKLKMKLRTKGGSKLLQEAKEEYKFINMQPLNYLKEVRRDNIKHNLDLKFSLLNELKFNKLMNFKTDLIRSVEIPKGKGKFRVFGIPTIKDRTVQMLIKLIMEPIVEPLGDKHSFGFRIGRGCHQAISCISNRTTYNKRKGGKRCSARTFGQERHKTVENCKGFIHSPAADRWSAKGHVFLFHKNTSQ